MRAAIAKRLVDADFIFGCTDSHGSRTVIQQVAYQYLIPCIDMGSVIGHVDQRITHIYGRVQMLAPGLPCLTCSHVLDPNEVRRDMMTEFERKADPYFVVDGEPAPAVMSLNATVSSLATTMFLSAVADIPGKARHLLYEGIGPALRTIAPKRDPSCYICSERGVLAGGDSEQLLARHD